MTATFSGRRRAGSRALFLLSLLLGSAAAAPVWQVVNLHPTGSSSSRLTSTTGLRQGGASSGHAALWSGTAASFVDLQPAGIDTTYIYGISATQQAGYSTSGANLHACLWNSTAASFVDLHPAGAVSSYAYATDGTTQAGYYNTASESHACIWTGTAASFVDLSPAGTTASQIMAAGGGQQGGRVVMPSGFFHAGIWTGTAASFVNLHPTGASYSLVSATDGVTQGGYGIFGGITHAGIWHGTAGSFIDIHPAGASSSSVSSLSGAYQAGSAYFSGIPRAALWNGTAASFIDLHALLPPGYSESNANGVWTNGEIIQVVGSAYNTAAMHEEAIIWNGDLFPHPPTVRVNGSRRRTTTQPRLVLSGTARDRDDNLLKVQVRIRNGRYRNTQGQPARWRSTIPLKRGANTVLVRATDAAGAQSRPLRVVLTRL